MKTTRIQISQLSTVFASLLALIVFAFSSAAYAGEKDKKGEKTDKDKEYSQEEIKREISFLAKKLLDMSGEDQISIESPAVEKPFIGVCSMVNSDGVKLTCITPDSQADKNGLKTGDVVVNINGLDMREGEGNEHGQHYWKVVKNMKTGEVLKMQIVRAGQPMELDVTVGSLTHPSYDCDIRR